MWIWCKNLLNENSGPQWRYKSNLIFHFFTKMGKCKNLVLEHKIKMNNIQNFRKKLPMRKLGPQNVFIILHAHFLRVAKVLKVAIFGQNHLLYSQGVLYYCNIYFLLWEIAIICIMRSRYDQKLTCAQIYEHPFTSIITNQIC